jgi:acid stress chaperone HdeA
MSIARLGFGAKVYKQLLIETRKGLKMKATAPVAIAIASLMFSGCSASQIINTGGDTKCKDFVSQDEKKQNEEVSKMLKDKSGADPATLQVTATRLSAATYCQTLGKPDSKISEAPHG